MKPTPNCVSQFNSIDPISVSYDELQSVGFFGRINSFVWVFLLVNGLLSSCSTKTDKPADILSKDEMAKALTEFYVKEAKINAFPISHDSALILMEYYRQKYALQNGKNDSSVERSYQYYLGRPDELSEIYDRIIDSLALQEQRINGVVARPGQ